MASPASLASYDSDGSEVNRCPRIPPCPSAHFTHINVFPFVVRGFGFQNRISSMQKIGKGEPVDNDEFDTWMKSKQLLKPDDQLDLTEAELGEEIPKLLSTENRHLP
uniref:Uncharacterized protein n=1 Tax=Anopheles maculatus TaxID=74869 RepID=A0A182ST95_9DIPT